MCAKTPMFLIYFWKYKQHGFPPLSKLNSTRVEYLRVGFHMCVNVNLLKYFKFPEIYIKSHIFMTDNV